MLFNRMNKYRKDFKELRSKIFTLGRDIVREGVKIYKQRNQQDEKLGSQDDPHKAALRKSLKENLVMPNSESPGEISRQQSMHSSQGVADHSGSSYHGPGKPGEKTNSNMWQRNFENHQGN
jgi:hypothetical protein